MAAGLRSLRKNSLKRTRKELSETEGPSLGCSDELTVEDLVRKLVTKLNPSQESQAPSESIEAILDIDIEHVHYTLVSSPSRSQYHLSPRETEIVRLVSEGLPNKCISAVLEISSWTVATHLRRIFAKLGVNSRAAMVAKLLESNLIREPSWVDIQEPPREVACQLQIRKKPLDP